MTMVILIVRGVKVMLGFDQMKWVGRMNSIRHRTEETIFSELIFAYFIRYPA